MSRKIACVTSCLLAPSLGFHRYNSTQSFAYHILGLPRRSQLRLKFAFQLQHLPLYLLLRFQVGLQLHLLTRFQLRLLLLFHQCKGHVDCFRTIYFFNNQLTKSITQTYISLPFTCYKDHVVAEHN